MHGVSGHRPGTFTKWRSSERRSRGRRRPDTSSGLLSLGGTEVTSTTSCGETRSSSVEDDLDGEGFGVFQGGGLVTWKFNRSTSPVLGGGLDHSDDGGSIQSRKRRAGPRAQESVQEHERARFAAGCREAAHVAMLAQLAARPDPASKLLWGAARAVCCNCIEARAPLRARAMRALAS